MRRVPNGITNVDTESSPHGVTFKE
jgi:hypothetical protein